MPHDFTGSVRAWLTEPSQAVDGDHCLLVVEDAAGTVHELVIRT